MSSAAGERATGGAPGDGWERPAALPARAPAEVHVWLDQLPGEAGARERGQAAWRSLLTPDEAAAAARLRVPERQASYVRGRWLLRTLVGAYAGVPPSSVALALTAKGKPAVVGPASACGLEVSLSRSGLWLAVALGDAPLGVDVEQERGSRDLPGVARRFFAPEEQAELAQAAPDDWTGSFFRCWARKEAVVKATGEGLAQSLQGFAVTLEPERPALVRVPEAWPGPWRLFDLAPAPAVAGALAVRGEATLRRLVWSDTFALEERP